MTNNIIEVSDTVISHMVLADMAAMNRIRDRIAEDKAASERVALLQSQNVEKPVPGSEEKNGLSQVVANSSRLSTLSGSTLSGKV